MGNFWNKLKLQTQPILVFAPMDGVTDYVFREIIAETAKPDVFFTEFTNTDALLSKGFEKNIQRLKYSEKQRYIVAQIWGMDPKNFYKVAKMVKNLGFDGIDINTGCPDRTVMKMGSGAMLIKNPHLTKEIINATKEGASGIPVSVKTRIGVDSLVTESWITFLLEQKLDAITIHGRTASELSNVPAHWEEIAKAVKLRDQMSLETVIIGNGDILCIRDAVKVSTKYGVDGVMIGKGVFQNPWVFERIPKIHSIPESLHLLLKHTNLFCESYPDKYRFAQMKKYFKIYVRSFNGADHLKKLLMETTSFKEVEKLVRQTLLAKKL